MVVVELSRLLLVWVGLFVSLAGSKGGGQESGKCIDDMDLQIGASCCAVLCCGVLCCAVL